MSPATPHRHTSLSSKQFAALSPSRDCGQISQRPQAASRTVIFLERLFPFLLQFHSQSNIYFSFLLLKKKPFYSFYPPIRPPDHRGGPLLGPKNPILSSHIGRRRRRSLAPIHTFTPPPQPSSPNSAAVGLRPGALFITTRVCLLIPDGVKELLYLLP